MPPEKQEKEIEVKVPAVEEQKEVKVDLETNKEVKPDPAAEAAAKQQAADEKERKRQEYLSRKFEQGLKKLDEVLLKIEPRQPAKTEEPGDPIEEAAQKDWKLGVKMVAENLLTEREQKARQEAEQRARTEKLDRSRLKVLERYPTVEDDSTEEGQLYLEAMNEMAKEDPAIYRNEYGPILVMNRMEEKLQRMGKTPAAYRPQVEQEVASEVARRQRVGAGSLPVGRVSNENIVVLTVEEQQMCKENGLPYARYAEMKRMTGKDFREGVSVR